jgi:hypothetical protein
VSLLVMSGSISDDSRSVSSSSNAVPLTSKGLPLRRLIFFSAAVSAGPKAADLAEMGGNEETRQPHRPRC